MATIVTVRILSAFLVPNLDGDARAYVRATTRLRDSLRDGSFELTTLFGFWPPGYQFISAVVSLVLPSAGYGCRVVSVVAGLLSCVFLWRITLRLTGSAPLAWTAAVVMGLMPYHVVYSSNAMTEVPTASLLLMSLDAALARRWTLAAAFLVPAGLMRVETWPLAFALPVVAAFYERRLLWPPAALAPVAPGIWLLICARATGNPWEYFSVRSRYVAEYLTRVPERRSFEMKSVVADVDSLLLGAHPLVFLLALGVLGVTGWRAMSARRRVETPSPLMVSLVYFGVPLTFLGLAWVTRSQPVIWVRYGLLYLSVGLPIALWVIDRRAKEWRRIALIAFVVVTLGTSIIQLVRLQKRVQVLQTRGLAVTEPRDLLVAGGRVGP